MNAVHIVSVGIGLLTKLEDPPEKLGKTLGDNLLDAIRNTRPWELLDGCGTGSDASAVASTKLTRWFAPDAPTDDLSRCLDEVDPAMNAAPGLWPNDISAEVDTFWRAAKSRPVDKDDIAILLATDTVKGLLAATWNALALVDGDRSRVLYRAAPDEPLGHKLQGKAVIVRIPGLDARIEEDFYTAMRGLGTLGRALLPKCDAKPHGGFVTKPGDEFRLYLSGGFKAAIPYLIGLAEGLRSIDGPGPVNAYMLHETTKDDTVIRLPLRQMTIESIRSAVSGYQNGERKHAPKPDLLEGYAYEKVGGRWCLTPFGEGLRTLVGVADESVGGL